MAGLSVNTLYAGANYSLSLNGSSQYVSVAASAILTPSSFTLEAWIKVPGTGTQTIVSRGDGSNGSITDYILQLSNDGASSGNEVSLFAGGAWDDSVSTVPINTWTHVAVTFDGRNKQFYINGVLDRTVPRTNAIYSTPTSPLYIGRQGSVCDCNFFNGLIAEVRLWSTVRTAAQINGDMSFLQFESQPAGLVAYYHLDEGSGTTAIDSSGNFNNGTLQNGATWANSGPPTLGTTNVVVGPAAGVDSVVLSSLGTSWTAKNSTGWLHESAGYQTGTTSTNVVFSFDANTGATRTGTVTIAGQTLTITQAAANYVAAAPVTTLVSSGLNNPQGVAADGTGNVYIADTGNNAIKVWSPTNNTVTTLVSSGLNGPEGAAVDALGNVYIADTTNNAIKECFAGSHSVTTLVSSGLNHPVAVAVDSVGNVYFADLGNEAVKEWSVVSHTVTTLFGYPFVTTPTSVAVDSAGNVYATDTSTGSTVEWSATTHTAAILLINYNYNNLYTQNSVAVDGAGNLYLGEAGRTVGEWSAATNGVTTLYSPGGNSTVAVAVDGSRNLYICDTANNAIVELPHAYVNTATKAEPLAGGGDVLPVVLPATENLLPPFAPSTDQSWLTVTNVTNGVVSFAFAAGSNNRVGHISLLGQNITVSQFNDTLSASLSYMGPAAGTSNVVLTVESAGPQAWTATSQASWLHLPVSSGSGSATVSYTVDPNPGTAREGTLTIGGQTLVVIQEPLALGWNARAEGPGAGTDSVVLSSLGAPWTATANAAWLHLSAGNQSGTGNQNVVFTFDANTGATRTGTLTIAGMTLTITQGGANYIAAEPVYGLVLSPQLSIPGGLTVDAAGNVYIADTQDRLLREWSANNNSVTTLLSFSSSELLDSVALDAAGNVFIASYDNDLVQEWSPASNNLTTLLSLGSSNPTAVAVDGAENVYVASGGNPVMQLLAANQAVVSLPSGAKGLALDAAGNVYLSGGGLLEVPVGSQNVITLVSSGLTYSQGAAVDGGGNVYVAGTGTPGNTVGVFSPATQSFNTLPINGLNFPAGVAVDALGNVYVADTDDSAIDEMVRAFVDPTPRMETSAAGNDSLPMVLPRLENLSAPFAPSSDSSWLTITGITNGIISFAFSANSGGDRTGNITVLGQSIPVTQLTYIALSPSQRTEGPAGGTDSVSLTSLNHPWTATANAPWLHLSSGYQSGASSTNLVFTFDANSGPTRVGTITIAGQTLTVVQEAVSLAASTRLEGPAAGMDSVLLQSVNTPWTATTNAPWLHLSSGYQSGTGSTNVVFSFDVNTGATRSGTLTIAGLTLNITQAGSTYVAAPGPMTLVSSNLYQPDGVAVDGSGNVYIADSGNNAVKEWCVASNTVITLTTNGLSYPYGVAVDGAGNVYVDSYSANTLQEWSPVSQTATVLVPNGLYSPSGIALDGVGNVYLADRYSYTIKEWSATGSNVTTLVSGLYYPQDVKVDFLGDAFIADTDHSAIKEWSVANGAVNTLVSSPGANSPYAIAVDAGANLYFADQTAAIKEWSPANSNLTTLFASPSDPIYALALDGAGNLYFADNHYTIKELPHAFVDPTPRFYGFAAGSDVLPVVVPATQNLIGPCAPTSDQPWLTITGVTNGVVSFAFTATTTNRTGNINLLGQNIAVTQFSYQLNTNLIFVGPGSGSNSIGLMVNADATQSWTASSQASWLHLVTTGGSGNAIVGFTFDANPGAARTGTLTIAGQTLTVIQEALSLGETARVEGSGAGSDSVTLASFNSPWVASANASWLHLSAGNQSGTGSANVVFSFDANTGATRTGTLTIAGQTFTVTQAGSTYVAAPGLWTTLVAASNLSNPSGVAVDGAGNVYIADSGHHAIKEWSPASNTLTTLPIPGLTRPRAVAVDGAGNVYIADTGNNAIEEWSPASNIVTTLISTRLNTPAVAVDSMGNVYAVDLSTNAVFQWSAARQTVTTLVFPDATSPLGVAVDAAGNAYISDYNSLAVYEWPAESQNLTKVFSSVTMIPYTLAIDGAGNVCFADFNSGAIAEWSVASNAVVDLPTIYANAVAVDAGGDVYALTINNTIVELPRAFLDPTAKSETAAAGSDVLPAVLPATADLLAPFAPTNSQPWLTITGVTNGVVSFAFTFNTGAARTNTITVLGRPISVTQSVLPTPILINSHMLGSGSFQFAFTNVAGGTFTVLSSTNVSLPLSNWTSLGAPVEGPPGQYQFTDTAATNSPRFYILVSP